MNYKEKLFDLLKKNMTERGYKLFIEINKIIPNIWKKPTSSTGKWHRKEGGRVPSNAEHTYELVYAITKISRMFNIKMQTSNADKLLFAGALHDSLKYGIHGTSPHTDRFHDKNAADMIATNKNTFEKILSENQFFELEEMVRFHSGRWSTDVPKHKSFEFKDYNPETLFIHMLDMLSTANLLKSDLE